MFLEILRQAQDDVKKRYLLNSATASPRLKRNELLLETMLESEQDTLDGLRTYIDGKMKRYSLLFSVNGGAFAIGKFLQEGEVVLGRLTIMGLAIGAIIFTIVMTVDIWKWGEMMRRDFLGDKAFTIWGKGILLILCVLLILGWALAAM